MSEDKTPLNAHWRLMQVSDLPHVHAMSCVIHPDFPEDDAVFADRLNVFADGALVLQAGETLLGYCFSHPWVKYSAPALNSVLQQLPAKTDTYYLHDIALLAATRQIGAGGKLVKLLVNIARAHEFDSLSLVAVNGSQPYWERQGFTVQNVPELQEKLRSYSQDACFMMRNV